MRLGIHLPQYREPVDGEFVAAAARAAENAGLDDVWVSDHVILPSGSTRPPAAFHDALSVLTWAAASTTRVGLGTSVLVAPYRHPVALAKSLATLDALSGGRVIAGMASGWMEEEFRALGVPFAERGARTDEAVEVCRRLWSGEAELVSDRVDARGLVIAPPPARPGGPPVWIGGNSPVGIRRAARLGDAWHTTWSDPARLADPIAMLRREEARVGRPAGVVEVSVRVRATPDEVAGLAPRLEGLGVTHVLVDPPRFDPATYAGDVRALRDAVPASGGPD